MKIADILDTKGSTVHSVLPWLTVSEVVERLGRLEIGAVLVCDEHGTMQGIVSERDIVRALNRYGERVLEQRVADVMSRGGPVCTPDESLHDLMAAMTRSRHRHVPVVEGGRLCGIVSIGDVVKHRLEEMELEVNVLRNRYIASR